MLYGNDNQLFSIATADLPFLDFDYEWHLNKHKFGYWLLLIVAKYSDFVMKLLLILL